MLSSHRWQSRTALLVALGITSTLALPILSAGQVMASSPHYTVGQAFPGSTRILIPAGTLIPVRYEEGEKIIVTPEETAPITVTVAQDIRSSAGTILIRAGSKIEGELRPAFGGTQFVAQDLVLKNSDTPIPVDASSEVITDTEIINEKTNPDILRGAVIGGAAGAVIAEIFGGIDLGEVLAGAGAGVLAELLLRGKEEVEVVVVNPETDLDLELQSDLYLN
ncbi:hypothetical protein [Lyngbya aestuarii]|uniref:hypothetical protein n=1 Tax=Lyngbya aestuarii TaxID=118322 RepID=UPI00403E0425